MPRSVAAPEAPSAVSPELQQRFALLAHGHSPAPPVRRHRLHGRLRRIGRLLARLQRDLIRTPAAAGLRLNEWLFENDYVVEAALRQVARSLPRSFLRELPTLLRPATEDELTRVRVLALADALVEAAEGLLVPRQLEELVIAYDAHRPLSIGELWALPTALRWALLERLHAVAARLERSLRRGSLEDLDAKDEATVAQAIVSLRTLDGHDWKAFFERVSTVERLLGEDPSGVYSRMDFDSRNRYRRRIEELARRTPTAERRLAETVVALSRQAEESPRDHVGYYLFGPGLAQLEARAGIRAPLRIRAVRAHHRHGAGLFLGTVTVGTVALAGVAAGLAGLAGGGWWLQVACGLLTLVPAANALLALVSFLSSRALEPRVLPRLDFERHGIPPAWSSVVAVPALAATTAEIEQLLAGLELNSLRNPDPALRYALLCDFADADEQELDDDPELLAAAAAGIEDLNARHGGRYFLFHRERRWNPQQRKWMAWERKRGKLHELNRWLRGDRTTSFTTVIGDRAELEGVRCVITLDADTVLPRGSAPRLIGTLAHPLNRPVFDARGRLASGYSILQPRVEIDPRAANRSRFTRIYAGESGIDLYSHAASDVYQDLFGEGIYAGKGIYDVDAFERSLEGRVRENALLSHDLFEGIHGRVALVSDISVLEDFPSGAAAYFRRHHRWVRGDWQLLPWLLPAGATAGATAGDPERGDVLGALDRFKVLDNLRRSLVAPATLALLFLGWFLLPAWAWVWTAGVAVLLGSPILFTTADRLLRRARGVAGAHLLLRLRSLARELRPQVGRWVLSLTFLPWEAMVSADAIARTLVRVFVTRRNLLEWTTAAHSSRAAGARGELLAAAPSSLIAVVGIGLLALRPAAAPGAVPLLLLWLLAPFVAALLQLPATRPAPALRADERRRLRSIARRTWLFFEQFVGPEDHWLPPDNYQEDPRSIVAHRTSPTNVGMLLISTAAAFDLGYLGLAALEARLRNTFESLEQLARLRGHWLNWYDTLTLEPLPPRYVSAVDSGNLAAALVIAAQTCRDAMTRPWSARPLLAGLEDLLDILDDCARQIHAAEPDPQTRRMAHALRAEVGAFAADVDAVKGLAQIPSRFWDGERHGRLFELGVELALVITGPAGGLAGELRLWLERLQHHLEIAERAGRLSAGWVSAAPLPDDLRARLGERVELAAVLRQLDELCELEDEDIARRVERCAALAAVATELVDRTLDLPAEDRRVLQAWSAELEAGVRATEETGRQLLAGFDALASWASARVAEMDFTFLYDPNRELFHIGFNVESGELDPNHYDLLASESRIASLVAIAKGDVPERHWLHLGRPLTRVGASRVLLSWGGTMFEYLMPLLFMPAPEKTLLTQSCQSAVLRQIRFARRFGIPWGMSESGFFLFDAQTLYQYKAFGVPGLGLKLETADRLVVSPYATILALAVAPRPVLANLDRLRREGMLGRYGWYESLDFGPRARGRKDPPRQVRSYMAHHQGMILAALDNALCDDVLVERSMADPRLASTLLLLHERRAEAATLSGRRTLDRRALQRLPTPSIFSWNIAPEGGRKQCHVVSNGRLHLLATSTGGVGIRYRDVAVTRFAPDATGEPAGGFVTLHDLESGELWTTGGPRPATAAEPYEVRASPHLISFLRHRHGILSRLELTVTERRNVVVQRLRLVNESPRPRRLAIVSSSEPVLTRPLDDRRHPAFQKLFVAARCLERERILTFERRPSARGPGAAASFRMLAPPGTGDRWSWCLRREDLLGRHGRLEASAAMLGRLPLPGRSGSPLDPVAAHRVEVEIAAGDEVELAVLCGVGATEAESLAALEVLPSISGVESATDRARIDTEIALHEVGIDPADQPLLQKLHSLMTFPPGGRSWDADPHPRSELWKHGISGDHPLLVVEVDQLEHTEPVRRILLGHAWWRRRGIQVDLVIVDCLSSGYAQPLRERLQRLIADTGGGAWAGRPGGIHLLNREALGEGIQGLEQLASFAIVASESLGRQVDAPFVVPTELPAFVPQPPRHAEAEIEPVSPPRDLLLETRLGRVRAGDSHAGRPSGIAGFSAAGDEYLIYLGDEAAKAPPPAQIPATQTPAPHTPAPHTPAPWCNVLANPELGCLVSESSLGCTWSLNSHENRLSPWRNDPLLDAPSEALYLRDEETGEVWSATPLPVVTGAPFLVRHGFGVTEYRHHRHGLEQTLTVFVHPDAPAKIARLHLRNRWSRPRRLTLTYYCEWVLGSLRELSARHIVCAHDVGAACMLAKNPAHDELPERVAFLTSSAPPHGMTSDRREFLGAGGLARPAALDRVGLGGGTGGDPCAALQVHVDLPAGEETYVHFALGQAADQQQALLLVGSLRDPVAIEEALRRSTARWRDLLSTIQVRTPDAATNVMLNGWLLYQTIASRLWGRASLYQSGGAFGFRDQLQDCLALLQVEPAVARGQILECCRRQFTAGDVLHWWHLPSGRGLRSRCSDDLLWLPWATASYLESTGDRTILDERVEFLEGAPLGAEEEERYDLYLSGNETASVYEHCRRAIERGATSGPRGLPLIGSSDWNDGLSRVGIAGRGESVWLAWFLADVMERFAKVAEHAGDEREASELRQRGAALRRIVDEQAWDGDWYRRAYYDDGAPLGSRQNEECAIDLIAQAWAVLSTPPHTDPTERAGRAMESAVEWLFDTEHGLLRLLRPSFGSIAGGRDPGYIKGYPPGVRENGGQYTHAAVWGMWALADLGRLETFGRLWRALLPPNRVRDEAALARYRVEPYVVAADVYSEPPWEGRGGWTWYTGSAGWLYRLGIERLLGLVRDGARLCFAPALPPDWRTCEVDYRHGETLYRIRFEAPDGGGNRVERIEVDGVDQRDGAIDLDLGGGVREVVVRVAASEVPVG